MINPLFCIIFEFLAEYLHICFCQKPMHNTYTKREQRFFYVAFAKQKKLAIFDAKIVTPECCCCNGGLLYAIFLRVIFEELHILQLGLNNSQCAEIISEEIVLLHLRFHKIFLRFLCCSFKFSRNWISIDEYSLEYSRIILNPFLTE